MIGLKYQWKEQHVLNGVRESMEKFSMNGNEFQRKKIKLIYRYLNVLPEKNMERGSIQLLRNLENYIPITWRIIRFNQVGLPILFYS